MTSRVFRSWARRTGSKDNPAHGVDLPELKRAKIVAPTEEAAAKLLDIAEGTAWALEIRTCYEHGLRRSECLGLRWEDVRFDDAIPVFKIQRTLQKIPVALGASETRLGFLGTKSEAGERRIPISLTTLSALKAHKAAQAARKMKAGEAWDRSMGDLVFDNGIGGPRDPDQLGKAYRRLSEKAGLPKGATIHGLRHAFATKIVGKVSDLEAAAILGHASLATTRQYHHPNDETLARILAATSQARGAK